MKRLLSLPNGLAILLAIVSGVLAFLEFMLPLPALGSLSTILMEGVLILAAFALLLGLLNLLNVHTRRLATEPEARPYSLTLLLGLVLMGAVGIFSQAGGGMDWLFRYMYVPLQASLTALLAFFIVTACYRAFRLRSIHAFMLVAASLFMLLAQLPFANALSPYLPWLRDWLMAVPVTAAIRGILLGTALGTLSTALRVLLAVDRPYLGE